MIDPALLLIPVLVLPIVLLFRFVGCGFDGAATGVFPPPPVDPLRYAKYLMGDPRDVAIQKNPLVHPNKDNIIGYWRLVDGDGMPAKNQIGTNHGSYRANKDAQSAFLSGQKSLVSSDTTSTCRFFSGGFVVVPYTFGLYTSAFTIEAWIEAQWTPGTKGRHTLFSAGGHFRAELDSTAASHGFELFADLVNGEERWDAVVRPQVEVLFKDPPNKQLPIVPRPGPTHVALTVATPNSSTGQQQVTLFVGGKPTVSGSVGIFSLPNGAPLFIGISPNTPDDANADGTNPILSKVQEVVLHKTALSAEEIENHATFKTE